MQQGIQPARNTYSSCKHTAVTAALADALCSANVNLILRKLQVVTSHACMHICWCNICWYKTVVVLLDTVSTLSQDNNPGLNHIL